MRPQTEAVLAGDRLSLARLITRIENQEQDAQTCLDELFPYAGKAHLIGVTGSPGSGKSSLVNRIAQYYRRPGENQPTRRVAIVAVDPTSPFTGGALLGDRVRMRDLAGDPDVFIRSMASRGTLGGLASATSQVVQVLDAAGFETIIIETVGVGQSEIDIARLAHTVLVVEVPGMGDHIQAGKAGILEIADMLVVNKADQDGADHTVRVLNQMLDLEYSRELEHDTGHHRGVKAQVATDLSQNFKTWRPPVLKTIATQGEGIGALVEQLSRHRHFLEVSGELKVREDKRLKNEFDQLLRDELMVRWRNEVSDERYQETLSALIKRIYSPREAVQKLVSMGSFLLLT
jgi:LAO/AO transport system kinase